jgi:hypothetical protein
MSERYLKVLWFLLWGEPTVYFYFKTDFFYLLNDLVENWLVIWVGKKKERHIIYKQNNYDALIMVIIGEVS